MRRQPALLPLLAALAGALAAVLPAQEGRFGETASVVVVEVPVNVTKGGRPVRGLTAEDFEVFDGKTKQRLTGFEVIDLAAPGAGGADAARAAAPRPALPLAARRHFLFLFDLTFAQPKSIVRAREGAVALARGGLHPTDLAAVATYNARRGAELVLGFTPDRAQLAAAIGSLGLPQLLDRAPDPLRLTLTSFKAQLETRGGPEEWPEGELILEIFEADQRLAAEQQARETRNQVVALTRSFSELAQMLASIDGRKHVVYLSEGFNRESATGRGADRDTADAIASGETWKAETEGIYGSTRVQGDVERMLEAFRRADCVVQAVDIGGVHVTGSDVTETIHGETAGQERGSGRDVLLTMARDTGGELFQNSNDLATAMAKMLERTSVTYLLAFQPEALPQDGTFHHLKVRLKGGPRGAQVFHRAGYYAPDPARVARPLERTLLTAAEILGNEEGGSLPIAALAVPLPGGALPLLVEIEGPALLFGHQGPALEVEIYAYALDGAGAVRGFLTQRVNLDLEKVREALGAGGLKFYGDLALPPGSYTVRLLVRNAQSGARALRSLAVEVPAAGAEGGAAAAAPFVSPPLFADAAGRWILAREQRGAEEASPPDPFLRGGAPFLPAVRPVLAAGAEAPVTVLVSDLAAEQAQVRAKVLDAAGREVAGGKLRIAAWRRGAAGALGRLEGSFATAGLPPGEYVLRVTVTDPRSGVAQSSTAAFAVAAAG